MALTYSQIKSRYSQIMPKGDREVTIIFRHATTTTLTGMQAHRMPLNASQVNSGQFSLDGRTTAWRVAAAQLSSNEFQLQDEIVDGSTTWVVVSADLDLDSNEWRLVTNRQR